MVGVVAARTNRVSARLTVIVSGGLNGYLLSGDGRRPPCHQTLLGNLHDDKGLVVTVHLTACHRAVHCNSLQLTATHCGEFGGEFGGDADCCSGTAGASFPSVNHPSVNRAKLVLSQPLRLCE